ncbi:MAG: alpha/beta hydrolase [bacterium]|nr:alpha/beta hydrolase [bacterium]
MASFQSKLLKIIMRFYIRPNSHPRLRIDRGRKKNRPVPTEKMIKGCSKETESMGGVPCTILSPPAIQSDSIILYLHGGAYVNGISPFHWGLLAQLCRETGRKAVMADYRLAPEFPYPAAPEDAVSVYTQLLKSNDAGKITIIGDSAGANLALVTALKLKENGTALPAKLVLLSPWLDVSMTNPDIASLEKKDAVLGKNGIIEAGKHYAGDNDPSLPLISPVYCDPKGLPPMLLQIGTHDMLLFDCRKFKEKAEQAGAPLTYKEWEEMFHDWMLVVPFLPEANEAVKDIMEFIR